MRGRNSTLSNSCAMRLPTSFRHHRANRSLRTSTKLNDVQPKLFRAARQDDHRVCAFTGFVIQIFGGRECRFRQAACLTIAQRFSALAHQRHRTVSCLSPEIGQERKTHRLRRDSVQGPDFEIFYSNGHQNDVAMDAVVTAMVSASCGLFPILRRFAPMCSTLSPRSPVRCALEEGCPVAPQTPPPAKAADRRAVVRTLLG
jgi:hypothetical protein